MRRSLVELWGWGLEWGGLLVLGVWVGCGWAGFRVSGWCGEGLRGRLICNGVQRGRHRRRMTPCRPVRFGSGV